MGRASVKRLEQALHLAVARHLDAALPAEAFWFHCPNGGARSKVEAGIFKALGVRAGFPDIGIVWRASLWCIELKAAKGRTTDVQLACHDRLRACGVPVVVCRSVDEVESILRLWQFPLKARLT